MSVDVGGLGEGWTRRSARAAVEVPTAPTEVETGRGELLRGLARPVATVSARRLLKATGWPGRWTGSVLVVPDPTRAVAGGVLSQGLRPGEANVYDLVVRLPYGWVERVHAHGLALLDEQHLVAHTEGDPVRPDRVLALRIVPNPALGQEPGTAPRELLWQLAWAELDWDKHAPDPVVARWAREPLTPREFTADPRP